MTQVFVHGCGAVSPGGWDRESLWRAVHPRVATTPDEPAQPGRPSTVVETSPGSGVLAVPPLATRPAWATHPRLRRASLISQYAVAASLEALGPLVEEVRTGRLRLGVIVAVMSGSVVYSRRFYQEVLRDPATASPLLFPETVYNAPASHLAAVLGADAANYTIVGDTSTYLDGLALGASWLVAGEVDLVVVTGAEECDPLTRDAWRLFAHGFTSGGAGALVLRTGVASSVELQCVSDGRSYRSLAGRERALTEAVAELGETKAGPNGLLVDSRVGAKRYDSAEALVWGRWSGKRLSPLADLGQGFAAGSAWQCVLAALALGVGGDTSEPIISTEGRRPVVGVVSVGGINTTAAVARFARRDSDS